MFLSGGAFCIRLVVRADDVVKQIWESVEEGPASRPVCPCLSFGSRVGEQQLTTRSCVVE